jgi:hypothetical protein
VRRGIVGLAPRSQATLVIDPHSKVTNRSTTEGLVSAALDHMVNDFTKVVRDLRIGLEIDQITVHYRRAREGVLRACMNHLDETTKHGFTVSRFIVARLFRRDDHVVARHEIVGQHEVRGVGLQQIEARAILLVARCTARCFEGHKEDVLARLADARDDLVGWNQQHRLVALTRLQASLVLPRRRRLETIETRSTLNVTVVITQSGIHVDDARLRIGNQGVDQRGHVIVGHQLAVRVGHLGEMKLGFEFTPLLAIYVVAQIINLARGLPECRGREC